MCCGLGILGSAFITTNLMSLFLESIAVGFIIFGLRVHDDDFIIYGCLSNFSILAFVFEVVGIVAVVKENIWLIWIYVVVMIGIILGKFTLILLLKRHGMDYVEEMHRAILKNDERGKIFFSYFYAVWRCCGMDGPSDFIEREMDVPKECYIDNSKQYWEEGCRKYFKERFSTEQDCAMSSYWICVLSEFIPVVICGVIIYQSIRLNISPKRASSLPTQNTRSTIR